MFNDLITQRPDISTERKAKCDGGVEHVFSEGAVMLAFAFHLFATIPDLRSVFVHPDGEHLARFDFKGWLNRQGFRLPEGEAVKGQAGLYSADDGRTVMVNPRSGVGDVVAHLGGESFLAECKGGVINTKHPGLVSRLRSGLCETVGLLLATAQPAGQRQFAVVPATATTVALAAKMRPRAAEAGIEIVLLDEHGRPVT